MALVDSPMSPRFGSEVKLQEFDSIIFDYGGVLVLHQTEADGAQMAQLLEMPPDRFSQSYWRRRADYDRADLTAAEYWGEIAGRPVSPPQLEQLVMLDAASWMHFDEPVWDWLGKLRQAGKKLAILSNMPVELAEALRLQRNRLELFDHVTLSCEAHAAKPEPQIYEQCMAGLGATPERTLFFDDRVENIQAAELLGIRAVQFLDRDAVLLQVS